MKTRPLTVYLDDEEIAALDREADEAGRSGVSSQIRWILARRREEIEAAKS